MAGSLAWCIVVLAAGIAVAASINVAQAAMARNGPSDGTRGVRVAAASLVLLLVLAAVWRSRAVARADGSVVAVLTRERGATLDKVMSVITTMGDMVPSFTIATVLALLIYMQGKHRYLPWALPLLILVQLVIQFAFSHVFHDVDVQQVRPRLPLGGFGTIPSGSVSRLLGVFLVAGLLWRSHDQVGARRLVTLGGILVVIETVTRLYLARHLLADILGGLFLGVFLATGTSLLFRLAGAHPRVAEGRLATPLRLPQPVGNGH